MRGERIEALSACFAAGVISGAVLFSAFPGEWFTNSIAAAILTVLLIPGISSHRRTIGRILAIYFAGGAFCYLTAAYGSHPGTGTMGPISRTAASFASGLRETISAIPYPDRETGALVTALLTGDRSGISRETAEIFRESGASHILALSGMHLGIIYMILVWIMVPLGNSPSMRKVRSCAIVAITFFYSLATGMSASITRAFLFVAIRETAILLGRSTSPSGVFCSALLVQLAIEPEVITSAGFQLSYLAMCGIILLFPRMEAWYPHERVRGKEKVDIPRRIWQASALGISCQIFTAPLVWIRFHSFPTYFLLTNLLAMPVTTAVMLTSLATLLLTSLGICPELLVCINERTVSTLIRVLTVISEI